MRYTKFGPLERTTAKEGKISSCLPEYFPSRTIPNEQPVLFSKTYNKWVSLASFDMCWKILFYKYTHGCCCRFSSFTLVWALKTETLWLASFLSQTNIFTVQLFVLQLESHALEPRHSTFLPTSWFCLDPKDNDMEKFQPNYILFCLYI